MQRLTEKQSAGYDLIDMKGLWCDLYCNEQSIYTCKDCAIDKAIQKLAEYEDLEEQGLLVRKKGKWDLLDDCANAGVYCSNCSKKVYRVDYANQKVKSKYCPNCGAKMEE